MSDNTFYGIMIVLVLLVLLFSERPDYYMLAATGGY